MSVDGAHASAVVTELLSYLFLVSSFEAILVFLVIPIGVCLAVALVTVVPNRAKARPKYTPGGSWDFSDRFYAGDSPVSVPDSPVSNELGGARGTW